MLGIAWRIMARLAYVSQEIAEVALFNLDRSLQETAFASRSALAIPDAAN